MIGVTDRHAGEPIVFFSYAHIDDQSTDGAASALRADLEKALRMVMGREVTIFQDRDDIAWGQAWESRIDTSLAGAKALIALVSPSFFASQHCRAEVEAFLNVERQLGRTDLVLPLLWVRRPVGQLPAHVRDLARLLERRQHVDWSRLRFKSRQSGQVQRAIHELADRLADVLWIDPVEVGSQSITTAAEASLQIGERSHSTEVSGGTDRRGSDARVDGEQFDGHLDSSSSRSTSSDLVVLAVDADKPALEDLAYL